MIGAYQFGDFALTFLAQHGSAVAAGIVERTVFVAIVDDDDWVFADLKRDVHPGFRHLERVPREDPVGIPDVGEVVLIDLIV